MVGNQSIINTKFGSEPVIGEFVLNKVWAPGERIPASWRRWSGRGR